MRDLKIYAVGVDIPEGYELTKEEEDRLAQENVEHENGLRANQILYKSGFKAGQAFVTDECLSEARSAAKVLQTMLDSFLMNMYAIQINAKCNDDLRALAHDVEEKMQALDHVLCEVVGNLM